MSPTDRQRRESRGIALGELLLIVALASTMLAATSALCLPPRTRANAESTAAELQTYVQLARLEAMRRDRGCRFELDVAAGRMQVLDTLGTAGRHDDELLYETVLASPIDPARDGKTRYESVFGPDGNTISGGSPAGPHGVAAAFGSESQRWTGARWVARR